MGKFRLATLNPSERLSARVLVVDDDPTIRTALAEAIRELGQADVSVAASAEDAIAGLESASAGGATVRYRRE